MMGLGQQGLHLVPADMKGQINPKMLDEMITRLKDEGRSPFYVNCMAGTTVLGGYDRYNEIADVCEKHGVWMHIDSCWGGAVALSNKHKYLLDGSGRADSITWNPHKMLSVPLHCTLLMIKEKGHLSDMFSKQAKYIFHGESLDLGTKTPQCGRKPDAFKLWLSWKRHGRVGFEKRVNHAFTLVNYFVGRIKENKNFMLLAEPDCLKVCFWYVPPSLREQDKDSIPREQLAEIIKTIHGRLKQDGKVLIDFAPLEDLGLPVFFRVIVTSPKLGSDDIDFIMSEIERHGADL